MAPYALRCEHRATPMEVDAGEPLLTWRLASARRADVPAACRVVVAARAGDLDSGRSLVWDSGALPDPARGSVVYSGPPLASRTRYHWRVVVTAADGATAHADAWFETGLQHRDAWQAVWIAHDWQAIDVVDPPQTGEQALDDHGLSPCPLLRRSFVVERPPARARVYVTARGLYELRINGRRVGDAELAPGWTDYRRRVQYRGYDVTEHLCAGENVLAATLADGWYSGFVGFDPRRAGAHYGRVPQLLAELHVEHADGRHEVIATDGTWRTSTGATRFADLLMGECVDARRALPGWDGLGFDDAGWRAARVTDAGHDGVEAAVDEPVRATQELVPRSITATAPGRHLVDLGQNIAGRVRLTVRGLRPGARVVLRHAEALDDDGGLYVANLRTADATDVYIAAGTGEERVEPRFTYHGFRYVEVSGVEQLHPDDVVGVVLHSDTPWAGAFACSDGDVDRLWRNIAWGQRGNFVSVPTDCPQRDERLGWLADAQVFLPTAALNADVTAFFMKWLVDVLDAQADDGAFSNVAPLAAGVPEDGAPGWGDAGVLVPWHLYRVTGDERILRRTADAMIAWVDHIHRHNPDLVWRHRVGPHFADWLAVGTPTDRDLLATAYFAHSTALTARAASVVGRDSDAARLTDLAERIRARFVSTFVDDDGRVAGETQTGCALALAFELLPADLVAPAAAHLAAAVRAAGPAITTGFLGVGLLAPVLDEHGYAELAHALLARTEAPSWRYPLRHGATTVWERWDGYTPETGFQAPAMNSFNHYALGSVGEWLYHGVAGLGQEPSSVGYRELRIRPRPGALTSARAVYESIRGRIEVAWERVEGRLRLEVLVPPAAVATVHVPTDDPASVHEDGRAVADGEGIEVLGLAAGALVCRVGSGRYRFTAANARAGEPDRARGPALAAGRLNSG